MAENLIGMLNFGTQVLPIATRSTLGAVKIGQGINVDNTGTVNLQVNNPLQIQTQSSNEVLSVKNATGNTSSMAGVVYAGDNVTISSGRLSVQSGGPGTYTAGYGLKLNGNEFRVNNKEVVCKYRGTYDVNLEGCFVKTYEVESSGTHIKIDEIESLLPQINYLWTACMVNSTNGNYVTGVYKTAYTDEVYAEFKNQISQGDTVELSVLKWEILIPSNNETAKNETIEDIMHYKNFFVTDPTKKIYYIGDTLDTAGMNVYFSLSYDEYNVIPLSDCTIIGFDSTGAGEKEIVISYEYQPEGATETRTFTYSVFVTVQKKAETIEVLKLPNKTKYFVNDDITFQGLQIQANYSDETSGLISTENCTITRYSELTEWGIRIYQVDYQDATTYFTIEIYEPAVEDIMIVPNGEAPEDPLDVLVYEVYNDKTIQLVTYGYEVTEIPPNDINAHQSTRINVKYKNVEKDLLIPTNRG